MTRNCQNLLWENQKNCFSQNF